MFVRLTSIIASVLALIVFCNLQCCAKPVPPIPSGMRIPDGTGTQISPPVLELTGVPLIVSNSPETIKSISSSAALYRTAIRSRHFRVFFHHLNATNGTLRIGVAITNPNSAGGPVNLFLEKNSQRLPTKNENSVRSCPAEAGGIALKNWFLSGPGDHYLCTLKPGETRYILQDVPRRYTVSGMYDFGIDTDKASGGKQQVYVTVLACRNLPPDPTVLHVLPMDKDNGRWHRRGTFLHSDRKGNVECDISNITCLDIAGPNEGRFACLMKNEIEHAIGDKKGLNPGNYGVTYSFHITLRNPLPDAVRVQCVLNAAGGPGWSNLMVDGNYMDSGKPLPAYGSWVCKELKIAPKSTSDFDLEFSLPGGANGAHRLYFWPELGVAKNTVKTLDIQL